MEPVEPRREIAFTIAEVQSRLHYLTLAACPTWKKFLSHYNDKSDRSSDRFLMIQKQRCFLTNHSFKRYHLQLGDGHVHA